MVVSIHRPTKAIIDLKAIKENVENEVARLPKATDLFAVVKANGYGHGAIETATAALEGALPVFVLRQSMKVSSCGKLDSVNQYWCWGSFLWQISVC